ncbi:MAG: hypothetical protein A3F26_01665 [Candidatus Ryanbacteria bacterium RIFCSPHIGHO2_12_FULL_47_12b]|uniref:Uncharacterized protein n=2 Tax=Candidatus Ryaniibacteriota TaxID=1817914 RepID=A0A1G2H6U3_9BACT|nr:MAG: hypothetical protein UX74_C0027G0010 [Parcubacteria group bacterium GW2011_GWA2_47_10b]OGZ45592.1 MAG: hypothetical protein A2844_01210 [Candidatus Ryanbacteria bacterium RIFCSPHIGHO2_01_FULL_48_80]OGZ51615.1 MAG: hypothetical protein A3F26_01665 [Candidatus Ryanbacteria bacterium RIFCSPHIGHO2_12_FULL_47_12b]OGZ52321.1 MAG: hypothetical protein A3A29_01510 [Candidatus Ryanbacteria bacterium RIFCSPLOWO2_01_FULL_47_79]OGZ55323.1 MAG: hypothetical protein A3J04_03755 [Candidatus Ryanbacter
MKQFLVENRFLFWAAMLLFGVSWGLRTVILQREAQLNALLAVRMHYARAHGVCIEGARATVLAGGEVEVEYFTLDGLRCKDVVRDGAVLHLGCHNEVSI